MVTSLDAPGTAAYSPAYEAINSNPILPRYTHSTGETAASGLLLDTPTVDGTKLAPPDPAVGGEPTQRDQLGWTTGLRNSREFRRRFTGATLVVPNMGVNPAIGPVGLSTRSQRLAAGVAALTTDYTPSQQQVAQSLLNPTLTRTQIEMLYPAGGQ